MRKSGGCLSNPNGAGLTDQRQKDTFNENRQKSRNNNMLRADERSGTTAETADASTTPVTEEVLGQTLCRTHDLDFATVFCQQFRLVKKDTHLPGFGQTRLGAWRLSYGRDLPMAELTFASGAGRVALLGVAVDQDGDVLTSEVLERKCPTWFDAEQVIAWLNQCAGRFAFVIEKGPMQRLYLDPIGSLGAVYDARDKVIASTLNLALTRQVEENTEYPLTRQSVEADGRFAFGHTPDLNIKRLIPNHYLDLTQFSQHRFWPLPGDIFEPDERQQTALVDDIVDRLSQVIGALAQHANPTYLPLSGGLDSRLLLACSKPALEDITLFSHAENAMSRKDTRIAKKLAKFVKTPMAIIDPIQDDTYRITDADLLQHQSKSHQIAIGIGIIGEDISQVRHEVLLAHPPGGLILRGNAADFMKAVLWRRAVKEYAQGQPHDIETGIRMMMLSDKSIVTNEFIQAAYAQWYQAFSGVAAERAYDFMFAEQFLSHGLGNLMYGMSNNFYICPFNDRRMLGAATCLPPDRRLRLDYNLDILDRYAPELNGVHYARKSVNDHLIALNRSMRPPQKKQGG